MRYRLGEMQGRIKRLPYKLIGAGAWLSDPGALVLGPYPHPDHGRKNGWKASPKLTSAVSTLICRSVAAARASAYPTCRSDATTGAPRSSGLPSLPGIASFLSPANSSQRRVQPPQTAPLARHNRSCADLCNVWDGIRSARPVPRTTPYRAISWLHAIPDVRRRPHGESFLSPLGNLVENSDKLLHSVPLSTTTWPTRPTT